MNNRKALRAGFVLLVLAAGATAWWLLRDDGTTEEGIRASGTVQATELDLGFQMAGRIDRIEPREGDLIDAGDLLATLDTRELEAEAATLDAGVAQARARLAELERGALPREVARAEAGVRAARATLEERTRDADRTRRLFDGGAVSREAMERAETARTLAEARVDEALEALELVREAPRREQVDAARAQLQQAEATRARLNVRLDNARLTAPSGGIVAIRHREPGETVGPGAPVITLRDMDDRWVRIYVPGDRIGRVHPGQRAEIRGDTHPGRVHPGEVFFIGSEAEFTPRNVQTTEERVRLVYPVRVRILDDPDRELKPGLPVDVVLLEDRPPEPQ